MAYHLIHTSMVTSDQEINAGKDVEKTEICTLLVEFKISTDIRKKEQYEVPSSPKVTESQTTTQSKTLTSTQTAKV